MKKNLELPESVPDIKWTKTGSTAQEKILTILNRLAKAEQTQNQIFGLLHRVRIVPSKETQTDQ